MSDLRAELVAALGDAGIEVSEEGMRRLVGFLELLVRWNRRVRLVGSVEAGVLARRHVAESLFLGKLMNLEGLEVVDVGSGGGFPGLALQAAFPGVRVTMVEVMGKKVAFLKTVARMLGQGRVVQGRLEEVGVVGDVVTARALERMEELGPDRFGRLVRSGGVGAFWVGRRCADAWRGRSGAWVWQEAVVLPGSVDRCLLLGRRKEE